MYIQLDKDMNLIITELEPIRRGDDMARKIVYLIPKTVGDIDMASAALYLSYRRADGVADIDLLRREEEPYNANYYEYRLPITTLISRFPGEVVTFITVFGGPHNNPMVLKSGVCVLHIEDSENLDDVVSDRNLRLVYSMQKQMEDKIAAKGDDLMYDEESRLLQLTSGKDDDMVPIGEPVRISGDEYQNSEAEKIADAVINKLNDGTTTIDGGSSEKEIVYFNGGGSSGV